MKVKIIAEESYKVLEEKANAFMANVEVVRVSVHEHYDIETDSGYMAYHIFYTDKILKGPKKRLGSRPL